MVDLNKQISNPFAKKDDASQAAAAEGAVAAQPNNKKKASRGSEYPTKTYMNLAQQESTQFDARKMLPAIIIAVLVVALFAYFGVFSFLNQLNAKQAELNQQQSQITVMKQQLANYDKVEAEYMQYSGITAGSISDIPSITDILTMVRDTVSSQATVSTVALEGNQLTLTLSESNLNQVASVTKALQEQPMVAGVQVSTASTAKNGDSSVSATMTVQLQNPQAASSATQGSATGGAASTATSTSDNGKGA